MPMPVSVIEELGPVALAAHAHDQLAALPASPGAH
jgi:hypothetical protein